MDILKTKESMRQWSQEKRKQSRTIGFVPTMGFLHKGHLSLMQKAAETCDDVVVSIFVNPTQFGPNEDLDSYPSNIERDLELAGQKGVSAVFLPNKDHIYPEHFQTEVVLKQLPQYLCGKFRPVHFAGVATVVTKLFNIVQPDLAVFGQKDYQQLQIIRRLTEDLDFDIEIVAGEIVRESDGLAMSSRNAYLTDSQRKSAVCLNKSLAMVKDLTAKGEKDPAVICRKMEAFIHTFEDTRVEYIEFCDPDTLENISEIRSGFLVAMVVNVGTTRLIDNALIDP